MHRNVMHTGIVQKDMREKMSKQNTTSRNNSGNYILIRYNSGTERKVCQFHPENQIFEDWKVYREWALKPNVESVGLYMDYSCIVFINNN